MDRPLRVVGYAVKREKAEKHVSADLIERASEAGIEIRVVDPELPLEQQGPFDVLLQKIRLDGANRRRRRRRSSRSSRRMATAKLEVARPLCRVGGATGALPAEAPQHAGLRQPAGHPAHPQPRHDAHDARGRRLGL